MKLATYQDGSRDGQLVVVSRDLSQAHFATGIAGRLQQLLDDWNFLSPQLEDLYAALNAGRARQAFAFDPQLCMAPLPRACQWAQPSGAQPAAHSDNAPQAEPVHPAMQQRAGDALFGPCTAPRFDAAADGLAIAPALAAITGDVAARSSPAQALDAVRLLVLAGAWSFNGADDAGTSFAPLALTPDTLRDGWRRGRVHATLQLRRGQQRALQVDTGAAMPQHFGALIAALATARPLGAGSIVGSGALSGAAPGSALLAALKPEDSLRIEVQNADGDSLFGAIRKAGQARAVAGEAAA